MDKLIEEIMSSLDNKNYLSALALTLTLPDICGKIEYPEMVHKDGKPNIGGRYTQWYNEYIYKYESTAEMENLDKVDGRAVYQLRCNLLHDGSSDIGEYMKKQERKKEPTNFVFELTDTITSYSKSWEDNEDDHSIRIRIGVNDFCNNVCSTAKNFYNETRKPKPDIYNNIIIFNEL